MLDRPMFFEVVVRRFLGQKAFHTANSELSGRSRNEWLRKVAKRILQDIESIDTYDDHKKQLYLFADQFRKSLGQKTTDERLLTYSLLGLVATLLGRSSVRGSKLCSPDYTRSAEQFYTERMLRGGDPLDDYYDQKNVVEIRRKIVADLKAQGIDDFHIAMALNTSESSVKKLKK